MVTKLLCKQVISVLWILRTFPGKTIRYLQVWQHLILHQTSWAKNVLQPFKSVSLASFNTRFFYSSSLFYWYFPKLIYNSPYNYCKIISFVSLIHGISCGDTGGPEAELQSFPGLWRGRGARGGWRSAFSAWARISARLARVPNYIKAPHTLGRIHIICELKSRLFPSKFPLR